MRSGMENASNRKGYWIQYSYSLEVSRAWNTIEEQPEMVTKFGLEETKDNRQEMADK